MARNPGSVIDVTSRRVCDRDGRWHALDDLTLADGALYYARPIAGNALFSYHHRWLLPDQMWVVNRFAFHSHVPDPLDWYIETDLIDVAGPLWRVRDTYLDVEVYDGLRYELRDAGELAEGITSGEIPVTEAAAALDALDRLCAALHRHQFSGSALLAELVPNLPR